MLSSISCIFHENPNLTLPSRNMVISATGQLLSKAELFKEADVGATKEIQDTTITAPSGEDIRKEKSSTEVQPRLHIKRFPIQKYVPRVLLSENERTQQKDQLNSEKENARNKEDQVTIIDQVEKERVANNEDHNKVISQSKVESFANQSGDQPIEVSPTKSWADRMDEKENEVFIGNVNEEVINNKELSTNENSICEVKENNEQISELEDSNVTVEGYMETSVGVRHDSGQIESTMSVDNIEVTVSGGHDSTEIADNSLVVLEEDHVSQEELVHVQVEDVGKETYVEGHSIPTGHIDDQSNTNLVESKDNGAEDLVDRLIDKTISEKINEEVEQMNIMTSDNAIVISSTCNQIGTRLKRSSPNNILHDLVSHHIASINIGKDNVNIVEEKEESILNNMEKVFKQAGHSPKHKSNNKGQKKGVKTGPIDK
ncbi:hypothetical protein K7X08_006220 [Anisodus acutangulus]|uniref:Uncharacterized protein n=1 Tax=Anisodus acutangulus TaxID=402998 RepID=A0A9Q1MW30_9SOLA|nr:hypothetical protein K7X08_006220 [Anisodus acutangulus]